MWNSEANLKDLIESKAHRFEFFEATRWLRAIAQKLERDIRFRTATNKSFPASQIEKLSFDDEKFEVFANFFGLVGPCGVLPHVDKDLVSGAQANVGLKGFLDVFDNRLISLFFDAWSKNRQEIAFESFRRKLHAEEDSSTLILMSLCGVSFPSVRNRCEFSDDVFPSLASFLTRGIRTADAVAKCISAQFLLPVNIQEFVRERKYLEADVRSKIGYCSGRYNQVGSDVVLGGSVEVFRERFEVELGPLNADEFHSVCPYGTNQLFRKIVDLVLMTLGRPLDVDIRFKVAENAVTGTTLGETRLGYNSWLNPTSSDLRNDPVKRFNWNYSREE